MILAHDLVGHAAAAADSGPVLARQVATDGRVSFARREAMR